MLQCFVPGMRKKREPPLALPFTTTANAMTAEWGCIQSVTQTFKRHRGGGRRGSGLVPPHALPGTDDVLWSWDGWRGGDPWKAWDGGPPRPLTDPSASKLCHFRTKTRGEDGMELSAGVSLPMEKKKMSLSRQDGLFSSGGREIFLVPVLEQPHRPIVNPACPRHKETLN